MFFVAFLLHTLELLLWAFFFFLYIFFYISRLRHYRNIKKSKKIRQYLEKLTGKKQCKKKKNNQTWKKSGFWCSVICNRMLVTAFPSSILGNCTLLCKLHALFNHLFTPLEMILMLLWQLADKKTFPIIKYNSKPSGNRSTWRPD